MQNICNEYKYFQLRFFVCNVYVLLGGGGGGGGTGLIAFGCNDVSWSLSTLRSSLGTAAPVLIACNYFLSYD